jgi:hypothetical protein
MADAFTTPLFEPAATIDPPLPESDIPLMANPVLSGARPARRQSKLSGWYVGVPVLVAVLGGAAFLAANALHPHQDLMASTAAPASVVAAPVATPAPATIPAPAPVVDSTPAPVREPVLAREERPVLPTHASRAATHTARARSADASGADVSAQAPNPGPITPAPVVTAAPAPAEAPAPAPVVVTPPAANPS